MTPTYSPFGNVRKSSVWARHPVPRPYIFLEIPTPHQSFGFRTTNAG